MRYLLDHIYWNEFWPQPEINHDRAKGEHSPAPKLISRKLTVF